MPKGRKCPECKGVVEPGRTELAYELASVKITVKNVRASVCSKCGQSFISGRVAEDVSLIRVWTARNFHKTRPL